MKTLLSALAMTGLCLSGMAQANAPIAIAKLTAGKDAYVSRNGKLVPLSVNMPLMAGDRLITRTRGSAKVAFNGKCTVTVRASAMLPISAAPCAKIRVVSLDQGRAGYGGFSSAQTQGTAGAGAGGAGAGGAGAGGGAAVTTAAAGGAMGGIGVGTVAAVGAGVAAAAGIATSVASSSSNNSSTSVSP